MPLISLLWEFKARQTYIMRLCLKKKKNVQERQYVFLIPGLGMVEAGKSLGLEGQPA